VTSVSSGPARCGSSGETRSLAPPEFAGLDLHMRVDAGHRGTVGPQLLTIDGVRLATRVLASQAPVRGAVVLVHGLTGSKDDPRIVLLASQVRARGFDVIAYDARGHGRSTGTCTLGDLERHDVAAAVAWARERSTSVVVIGASMGAVAALSYAATDLELAGVVAVSSPSDWRVPFRVQSMITAGLARTRTGRAIARRWMHVRIGPWTSPEPPRSVADRISCPLVAVHGQRDPIVPSAIGLGSSLGMGQRRSVVTVPAMGHAFDPIGHKPICDALEWVVNYGDHRTSTSG
jgi:pimeloyl-ACP methyl ester carboxylesterase